MLKILKNDDLVKKIGGKFRLTALIQRRLRELVDGARPLVESKGKSFIEIALEEIAQDKIAIDYEKSENIEPPTEEMLRNGVR